MERGEGGAMHEDLNGVFLIYWQSSGITIFLDIFLQAR
jgi:hypothetical protein